MLVFAAPRRGVAAYKGCFVMPLFPLGHTEIAGKARLRTQFISVGVPRSNPTTIDGQCLIYAAMRLGSRGHREPRPLLCLSMVERCDKRCSPALATRDHQRLHQNISQKIFGPDDICEEVFFLIQTTA